MGRDYYNILGCARDADDAELKRCYKKQAMRWHPDRHASKSEQERKNAEEQFKALAEAYETLSDPNKRAIYDKYGEEGLKSGGMPSAGGGMPAGGFGGMPAGGFGGMPGGATFTFSTSGGAGGGMDAARAQELFASLFGAGGLGAGGLGAGGFGQGDDPFASMMMGGMGGGMGGLGGGLGGGVSGRRRHARSGRVDTLPRGTAVRLVDLSDASHNGAVGRVDQFDEARQRYVVSVGGSSLAVRAHNVRQIVTDATVVGTSQAALNGGRPAAAVFDRASKRYRCEGLKGDGTVLSLRPENVRLPIGTIGTIDGVNSRKELNGRQGKVVGVQDDRYVVQMPNNEAVKLRFGAVAAC